jgi:hypothetical protein
VSGDADFQIEGEDAPVYVGPETAILGGPAAHRKFVAGPEGVKVLALGGVPGGSTNHRPTPSWAVRIRSPILVGSSSPMP